MSCSGQHGRSGTASSASPGRLCQAESKRFYRLKTIQKGKGSERTKLTSLVLDEMIVVGPFQLKYSISEYSRTKARVRIHASTLARDPASTYQQLQFSPGTH